ncbi:MAG: hypothetical protein AAGD43_24155 [Pseudomonadota bacterium]
MQTETLSWWYRAWLSYAVMLPDKIADKNTAPQATNQIEKRTLSGWVCTRTATDEARIATTGIKAIHGTMNKNTGKKRGIETTNIIAAKSAKRISEIASSWNKTTVLKMPSTANKPIAKGNDSNAGRNMIFQWGMGLLVLQLTHLK